MEYLFAESLLPIDFMNYFNRAMQIEEAKSNSIKSKEKSQYLGK